MSFVCETEGQKIKICMKERNLYLEDKITIDWSEKQVIIYSFLLTESQPSVDSMIIFSIKKSKIIDQDSNILKVHSHGT